MADTSNEYISKVLHAAPFADNDAGIPQMCELIRGLQGERNRLKKHLDNESECIGSCEHCSTRIYDGDEYSTSIDGCHFCAEHSAMLSECLAQMEQHLAEAGDEAYIEYECADQAEFLSDIASLKHQIAEGGDRSTAST